mmetsp:Transcript_44085/g.80528  ORF Transcript_44085/g.80528 Transcript_44085/m.80528 type:complete len:229 (-) Transcript_44085:186-872(-)
MAQILCYGDSNTAGFHSGGRGFEPYAFTMSDVLARLGWNCRVTHDGLSGLTAGTMVAKMHSHSIQDVTGRSHRGLAVHLQSRPDLVVLMAGTNDIGKGSSPEETMHHIATLHQQCHAMGIPTIAVAPPSLASGAVRQKRDRLARMLHQWSQQNSDCVLSFEDAEAAVPRGTRGFWESDELHLSPNGSRELGAKLASHVAHTLPELGLADGEDSESWINGLLSAFMGRK